MTTPILEKDAVREKTEQCAHTPVRVCFVCTGNTCRSPMAEAVAKAMAKEKGAPLRAFSAGLYAHSGDPIAPNAALALEQAGIEALPRSYRLHTAHTLTEEEAEGYDLLVGMGHSHVMELLMRFPTLIERIRCFDPPISDPFGGDLARYEECLAEITRGIRKMLFSEDDS